MSIKSITAADILNSSETRKPTLIAARPTLTVAEALDLLARHNILSLPIYSHDKPGKVVNIVNVYDLLSYLVGIDDDLSRTPSASENFVVNPKASFDSRSAVENLRRNIEAVMTLDADRESYLMTEVDLRHPLAGTIEAFGKNNKHRILVVDFLGEKEPFVLSQTDILNHIRKHPESIGDASILQKSLAELGMVKHPASANLVCATEEDTALAAYKRMGHAGVLAVPVLNVKGELIANLSASDLRGRTGRDLGLFNLPVLEFLKTAKTKHADKPPITTTSGCTLQQLLETFHREKIHRVWIVDEHGKPYDVVSMTDVCALVSAIK